MLSFAGLEPGYFQSGQSEHTGHMVKRGSSHLRCAIMNCCLPLIQFNMTFAEFYAKNVLNANLIELLYLMLPRS